MATEQFYYRFMNIPLGKSLVAVEADTLIGVWFVGQKYYPQKTEHWIERADHSVFTALRGWFDSYFAGEKPVLNIPLAPRGTPFQKSVWDILLRIPYGKLTSYGTIARQLAARHNKSSLSAQAVGGAVGHNPISLLIPCHRVVGSNGKLTGYAGGLDKKEALLRLEGAVL